MAQQNIKCPLCSEVVVLSLSINPKLTITSSYESFLTAEVGISGVTHHCPKIEGQTKPYMDARLPRGSDGFA